MHCNQVHNLFFENAEMKLDIHLSNAFNEHLLSCDNCRKDYFIFSQYYAEMDAIALDVPEPSTDLTNNIFDSIENMSKIKSVQFPIFIKRSLVSVGIAASLLVGIWIGMAFQSTPNSLTSDEVQNSNLTTEQDNYLQRLSDMQYVSFFNNEK